MLPWHSVVAQTGVESIVMGSVLACGADVQSQLILSQARTVSHVRAQVQSQRIGAQSRIVSHGRSPLVVALIPIIRQKSARKKSRSSRHS